MNNQIKNFIFNTFEESFNFVQEYLPNYSKFTKIIALESKKKEQGDPQYNFDIEIDNIFKNNIKKHKITGKIFSEESGFWNEGDKKFRVVYDPFCGSSMAAKGLWNAAVGVSIFDYGYNLITSAILDYQIGVMGMIEDDKVKFYQIQDKKEIQFNNLKECSDSLEDSFVVLSIEKLKYRTDFDKIQKIIEKAGRLDSESGHICWLRLAMGNIQVYTDPIWGEKLYEMFACSLAQKSGCKVTNLEGEEFCAGKYLKIFEEDQNFVYRPVASRSKKLHKKILGLIDEN